MNVRSNFAITRLLVLPYAALLALYLLVVGGGEAWLWHQVRTTETRLLIDDMLAELEPLAQRLRSGDALATMRDNEGWLVTDIERLFAGMPALSDVSIRGTRSGYQMARNGSGAAPSRAVSPLAADARRATDDYPPASTRLHDDASELFLIRFDLVDPANAPVRLDYTFDRAILLARIDKRMTAIKQSILLFGIAGAVSILIALAITGFAIRTTRELESHFQGIYQRASLAETAAQLVHDLRNPLAALRANVKALLVAPEQTQEIASDLDRDIVALNDRLRTFLDLTREHKEAVVQIDVAELIGDAVRLAEPVLAKQGLTVETRIEPELPQPYWQKAPLRDTLLNLLLNAGQSGQREGSIRVTARAKKDMLEIAVEDRGSGIPEKQMRRLFEAFYTTREDGNGLGLAIVQRIVTEHQGRVHAENRPGGGARIVLTLPLQRKETPSWWNRLKKHSPA